MSLIWTLRRFADPLQWLKENEDKRRARESQPGEPHDGGGGPHVDEVPRPAEWWACRICSRHSTSGSYCPTCLADTMQRVR